MDALVDAIKTYGTKNLGGLTIGNEYLLQSYGDNGTATDAKGVAARTKLLDFIQQTNSEHFLRPHAPSIQLNRASS